MSLKIKICGMREPRNINDVAALKPDLMGFIFYPLSPRYAEETLDPVILSKLSPNIYKTGVFVNEDFDLISRTVTRYSLDVVQLHGNETPDLCSHLKDTGIRVIKTFSISAKHNFEKCSEFITCTDYFLFDTASSGQGGSGLKFNWKELNHYDVDHPFFLSGGISPDDFNKLSEVENQMFFGIDLNSRFELKPGKKDPEALKNFISKIRQND